MTGAAYKNPSEAIWWVTRLAHYCYCKKGSLQQENLRRNLGVKQQVGVKSLLSKLFNETDMELERFGKQLLEQIKRKAPENIVAFLSHIYSVMELRSRAIVEIEVDDKYSIKKSPLVLRDDDVLKLPSVQATSVVKISESY